MVTDEQAAFFEKNGYLVARPVLTTDELAEVRDVYNRVFQGQ